MSIPGLKTYQLAMIQAKAYRRLREHAAKYLEQYDLASVEWALLGYIAEDTDGGTTNTALADLFGVKVSFMTNTINGLVEKGLVKRNDNKYDGRKKMLQLTKKGRQQVDLIEADFVKDLSQWLAGIDHIKLQHYIEIASFIASARDGIDDDF